MKYTQINIPSPNPVYPFNISSFQGGFNNRDSYTEILDNQSPATLNVDLFKETGVIQSRGGSEIFSGTGVDEVDNFYIKNDVLYEFRKDGKFYVDGALTFTTVVGGVEFTDFNNLITFIDGEKIRYYGTFPQTSSTYINVVGTPIATPIVFTLIPTTIGYTPLGTTHIIGKTVYNYINGTVEYQPCQNEVNDEYKGISFPIEDATVIMNRVDRIYMAGSNTVENKYTIAISDVDNPFYFPVSLQLGLEPNGDEVMGLFNFHNVTVVGRKNDIHAIYGNTNRTDLGVSVYNIKRINTHTGFKNKKSFCMVNNYMFYLGNDNNIYAMYTPQTDVEQLTTTMINKTVDLKGNGIHATAEELASSTCLFDGNYFWISVGKYVLIYSYLNQAWQVWSFGVNINRMFKYNNEVYFSTSDGYIVKYNFDENVDYLANTVVQYHYTKQYDMGQRSRQKVWKSINIVTYIYEVIRSTINLAIYVDFDPLEGIFDILSSAPRWDEGVFGSSKFFGTNVSNSTPILVNGRGRLVQFIFSNSNNEERFKVFEINGEYELRGFR